MIKEETLASQVLVRDYDNRDFFIAIAKKGIHSFIFLGLIKEDGMPFFLARVGKQSVLCAGNPFCCLQSNSRLCGESLHCRGPLTYAAYAIKAQHYEHFLHLLSVMTQKKDIACYVPLPSTGSPDRFLLKGAELTSESPTIEETQIDKRCAQLHLFNTCRHTAMDVLRYVLKLKQLPAAVSSLFFKSLPCTLADEHTKSFFYVFPLPPAAHSVNKLTFERLQRIYQRMEKLVKKAAQDELTWQKFNALKALYNQQVEEKDLPLDEVLHAIQAWHQRHQLLISQLRCPGFFTRITLQRAATAKWIEQLEQELSHTIQPT